MVQISILKENTSFTILIFSKCLFSAQCMHTPERVKRKKGVPKTKNARIPFRKESSKRTQASNRCSVPIGVEDLAQAE